MTVSRTLFSRWLLALLVMEIKEIKGDRLLYYIKVACPPLILVMTLGGSSSMGRAEDGWRAGRLLELASVRGGLVVHVGCGDGRLTAELGAREGYLVQGLDADEDNVAKARAHIRALGLYGKVSVDTLDGPQLPYIDNLVNLLVVEKLGEVSSDTVSSHTASMDEVMRVLAPGGVALVRSGDSWRKTVKPWPDDIDEWTHFQHGPDNNSLAEDDVVGPPRRMQWLAGPTWTRHHNHDKGTAPAVRGVVSSGGRLFYTVDETESSNMQLPGRWSLAARDAFSGVLLWKVPIENMAFDRRLERVWRELIADGDEVYAQLGAGRPLCALDAASGKLVREYAGTENLLEVIKYEDTLLAIVDQNTLRAVEADTGKTLWQWDSGDEGPIIPLTLAASDGRVLVRADRRIHCLSADDGVTQWRFVPQGAGNLGAGKRIRLKFPREKLLISDGVVLASYGGTNPTVLNADTYAYLGSHPRVHEYNGKLAALDARDGSVLWTTDYLAGLESMPGEIYVCDGRVWLGPDFAGPRDLRSGKVLWNRPVLESLWTAGHHYRCYPGKATRRYIITAKRGIEMFDLDGDEHSRNNWARGTCRVGVTPCNGLIYAPPHSCGCYMEAKLNGFWALAPEQRTQDGTQDGPPPIAPENRLRKGPAYGQVDVSSPAESQGTDWWTYRGNSARSGSTDSPVASVSGRIWRTKLGGRLSAITMADGRLFVAQVDAHTVHALDARDGKALWRFTAAARVDSPPTIYRGLALFGSRDGQVYCLRASDGELVWRFQAAPRRMAAVAHNQIESLWPVHGSVLIDDGVAYVAAGRSSYLDGGIVLVGLDPATGKTLYTKRLASEHAKTITPPAEAEREKMDVRFSQNHTDYKTFLAPDRSDAFSMAGALTDVLVADGRSIFMRHLRFDRQLKEQKEPLPHLFSTSTLLDGREHDRSYWVLGTANFSRTPVAFPWLVARSMAVPHGVTLAFDAETVWGVRRGVKKHEHEYSIFASPRPDPAVQESLLPDFAVRSGQEKPLREDWVAAMPLRPRAMIRAGDRLFVGGMTDQFDPNDPINAEHLGDGKGWLQIASVIDGKLLARLPLEAPPVWDGMAAAGGRLFISTRGGTVICLGGK